MTDSQNALSGERGDLLQSLAEQREFLRFTVRRLTEEQASQRTTVSELTLGGLIKHVADVERMWTRFAAGRTDSIPPFSEEQIAERNDEFTLLEGETLAGVLDDYAAVARETEQIITDLPDLDQRYALPEAPWFPPGTTWSARTAMLHVIRETAHHSGHADILRESLDGATTMTAEALSEYSI